MPEEEEEDDEGGNEEMEDDEEEGSSLDNRSKVIRMTLEMIDERRLWITTTLLDEVFVACTLRTLTALAAGLALATRVSRALPNIRKNMDGTACELGGRWKVSIMMVVVTNQTSN